MKLGGMNIFQMVLGTTPSNDAGVDIRAQHGQGHFTKASQQQRLGLLECLV